MRAVLLGWELIEVEGHPPRLQAPPGWADRLELSREVDEATLAIDLAVAWPLQADAIRAAARLVERLVKQRPELTEGAQAPSPSTPELVQRPDELVLDHPGADLNVATAEVPQPAESDPEAEMAQGPTPWRW